MSRSLDRLAAFATCVVAVLGVSSLAPPAVADVVEASSRVQEAQARETGTAEIPAPEGRFGRQLVMLAEPLPIPDYVFEERRPDGTRRDHGMLEFRGRVVVLNFWASWCGVCAKEMPKLDAIAADLTRAGVDVVALSIDDDIEIAQRALRKRGHDDLRVFHDTDRVLSSLLGVRGVPTTFVIGPDGLARAVVQGPADWRSPEALAWLRALAATEPGPVEPGPIEPSAPVAASSRTRFELLTRD